MKRLLIALGVAFLTCLPLSLGAQEVSAAGDQEYEPLQKILPLYPSVSQWNGIEGWCIVTFGALQLLIPHYYQTNQYEKLLDIESRIDIWLFRLIDAQEVNRMALMIADAYGVREQGVESNKRFQQIIDRAELCTADSYVTMARQVLGQ